LIARILSSWKLKVMWQVVVSSVCFITFLLLGIGCVGSSRCLQSLSTSSCCAKSPDFVPIAICRSNFSNLYFPMFVDYWNCSEVVRLRRAITIIFLLLRLIYTSQSGVCCEFGRLCRAGNSLQNNDDDCG
jgi:hypothetical protein